MATGPQDQPDFIKLSQSAAPLQQLVSQQCTLTTTNSAWIYVGNVTTLIVNMSSAPLNVLSTCIFQFANDSVGTFIIHQVTGRVDITHPGKMMVPVLGNWMRMRTGSSAADNSGHGLTAYIEGVSYVPRMATLVDTNDMLISSSLAVAVNAIVNIGVPRHTAGAWIATLNSTQSGVFLSVQQETGDNIWQSVGQVSAAAFQTLVQVYLAQVPTRLAVQNTSGAVADLFFTLIPGP